MATSNTNLTFKGNKLNVAGKSLSPGDELPQFTLTANDMSDSTQSDYAGKILVICAVPSLDTPVCDTQTKRFNQEASELSDDVVVLTVSRDLPFAQKRWCGTSNIDRIVTLSDYLYRTFGKSFGVDIEELGIFARAIFVADKAGKLVYVDYVDELSSEPEYEPVLAKVRELL